MLDYRQILDLLKKSSKTMEVSSIDTVMFKCSTIEHNSINAGTSENILWSNSSIQMWCTSMDWKTGYVIKTGPTEKFL